MQLEKITNSPEVARRSYDDACGTAHALDLIGERWAMLVMRELMLGPKRFSDLRADLPGISANVLTQRLERLEQIGVLVRKKLAPPASIHVYELTPWGYEAEPIIQMLGRWAARSPAHDPTLPISATSLCLSFRTMFDAARARGFDARVGLHMGAETYLARIANGRLTVERDTLDRANTTFVGPPSAIAAAVYGGQRFEVLAKAGALSVEGDVAIARRFATLFPLPAKLARA